MCQQIFVEALRQVEQESRDARVTPIIRRLTAPIRVAVRGRDGVGRATVAAALTAARVSVSPGPAADIDVLVIAEALKPEDRALIGGSGRPAVVVLNKADLTGFGAGGPVALAHQRAARCRGLTGLPTVPMIALLADVVMTDDLLGALHILRTQPADLTSTDAFTEAPHPLPRELRERLLGVLDRFGIAHAVLALDRGVSADSLQNHLRQLSRLDRVVEHIHAAGAPLRYQRLRVAVRQLRALAAQSNESRLTDLLVTDDSVLAMMTAAVDVVEAAGVTVDRDDGPAAHLGRAVHWQRYGSGPVDRLHRACAADISRGSLRLLERSR
ncbi:hypothetical protein QGN32_10495 [Mycolicibacterium sp. ND9-15]|uniref:hypothetical protein n=1 Tax=Mycolicibacterium sp. ND9-15 TaxID=3042320 RepID=UPI002DD9FD8A|nr:hypothetical protein [Mycolicibacterium sp. ND9-15]WSE58234.1 hypothetical protein QGN32_10495 [Mycolicibacterium sp. ND9-15]